MVDGPVERHRWGNTARAPRRPSLGRCTLVIPTKDRPERVDRLLRHILALAGNLEQVVVVDQSRIDTGKKAAEVLWANERPAADLVYVLNPAIDGAAGARNAGFPLATAPYIVFLDDDALPAPDCLPLLVEALDNHPNLLAVGGLVSNYSPPPLVLRLFRRVFYLGLLYDERQAVYWRAGRYAPAQLIPTTKLTGCCMAFRREVIAAVGGFDSRYCGASVGEDIEISQRLLRFAGRRDALALVGGALIHHASEGGWKSNPRALEYEIVATHYWFKKNHPWNLLNRMRFTWMCLGLLLRSAASAIKRRSLAPLRAFTDALSELGNDYRNCPFLKQHESDGHVPTCSSEKGV